MTHGRTDGNQADIIQAFQALGCFVVNLSQCGRGIPDLLVIDSDGETMRLVEVKRSPVATFTPEQREFSKRCPAHIQRIHDVDQATALVQRMRGTG